MRRSSVLSGLCALALAGGFLVADVVAAPEASACSSMTYYPTWGWFNRQGLQNDSNPNRLYFYQGGKVGSYGATAGNWTTGGKGVGYCGTNFFYSVDKNL
jgi:hypothetical protein